MTWHLRYFPLHCAMHGPAFESRPLARRVKVLLTVDEPVREVHSRAEAVDQNLCLLCWIEERLLCDVCVVCVVQQEPAALSRIATAVK